MKLDWLDDGLRSDIVKCKSKQERPGKRDEKKKQTQKIDQSIGR